MFKEYHQDPMYLVNKQGDVLSKFTGKLLKPSLLANGYFHVNIRGADKVRRPKAIHRMVAETFIEPVQGKTHVNHKDSNKLNNSIENLEWCTNAENRKHAVNAEAHAFGSNHGLAKLTEQDVHIICGLFTEGYSMSEIIGIFKVNGGQEVSRTSLMNIRGRRTWKHISVKYPWRRFNTANKRSKRATTISEESTPK